MNQRGRRARAYLARPLAKRDWAEERRIEEGLP